MRGKITNLECPIERYCPSMRVVVKKVWGKWNVKAKNAVIHVRVAGHQPRPEKVVPDSGKISWILKRRIDITKCIIEKTQCVQRLKGYIWTVPFILIERSGVQAINFPSWRTYCPAENNSRPNLIRFHPRKRNAAKIRRSIQYHWTGNQQIQGVEQLLDGQKLTCFEWWEKQKRKRFLQSAWNGKFGRRAQTATWNVEECQLRKRRYRWEALCQKLWDAVGGKEQCCHLTGQNQRPASNFLKQNKGNVWTLGKNVHCPGQIRCSYLRK